MVIRGYDLVLFSLERMRFCSNIEATSKENEPHDHPPESANWGHLRSKQPVTNICYFIHKLPFFLLHQLAETTFPFLSTS